MTWQMELLDEAKRPVFRIRIVAESLDQAKEWFAAAPFWFPGMIICRR